MKKNAESSGNMQAVRKNIIISLLGLMIFVCASMDIKTDTFFPLLFSPRPLIKYTNRIQGDAISIGIAGLLGLP